MRLLLPHFSMDRSRRQSSRSTDRLVLPRLIGLTFAIILEVSVLINADVPVVQCRTIWGDVNTAEPYVVTIPTERINDNYCDCVDTGADETETEACAGLHNWGALPTNTDTKRQTSPLTFQCPQQPELQIPVSHLNDGICDCCDGTDEHIVEYCEDNCAALRAAREAAEKELQQRYTEGSKHRAMALQSYIQFQTETKTQLGELNQDVIVQQQKVSELRSELQKAKLMYAQTRRTRREESTIQIALNLLGTTLSAEELMWVIVHTCQVAGEMPDATGTACIPLRLAALDIGILWNGDNQDNVRMIGADDYEDTDTMVTLAELYCHNSDTEKNQIWTENDLAAQKRIQKQSGGRQLMRVVQAEEDFEDGYENDDYLAEENFEEDMDAIYGSHEETDSSEIDSSEMDREKSEEEEKLSALREELERQSFVKVRMVFRKGAEKVIAAIEELLNNMEEESDGKEEASPEEEEAETYDEAQTEQFDVMAYNMVRRTLNQRKSFIKRGIDYALSARLLLESLEQNLGNTSKLTQVLSQLVVGTLYFSKVSEVQFYEVLASALPGLLNEIETESEICASPWSRICPPKSLSRDGVATIPPLYVVSQVEKFCAKALSEQTFENNSYAAWVDDSNAGAAIPTNASDGIFGYFEVASRSDSDVLNEVLKELDMAVQDEINSQNTISEMEEKIDRLEHELSDLETKIEELENSIGSDDPEKYGFDGELHSLLDECFSVEEGKYVYELCLFGSALQKDKGSHGGGTNLGQWSGAATISSTDDRNQEYLQRIWKWEKGAKCWNGPHRSATAHVTCGSETKVLSADEPDTCRYVMMMESPLACDEDFRRRNGL